MTTALGDRRPILAVVSDRRRLLPQGGDAGAVRMCLLRQAQYAVDAEVDLFQIREPGLEADALHALAASIVAAARGSRTRVLVNDRLDVALAAGADGVHLRADSLPPAAVRAIVPPGFLVGRSVHGAEEAVACAAAVDYLIAGTVFASASKPAAALLGVEDLRRIVQRVAVPVLAIGGVTAEVAPALAAAGAAGLAGIGAFLGPDGSGCRAVALAATAAALRVAFDRGRSPSYH